MLVMDISFGDKIMTEITKLEKKAREVKLLHAAYKERQAESNAVLATYKRAVIELEEMV